MKYRIGTALKQFQMIDWADGTDVHTQLAPFPCAEHSGDLEDKLSQGVIVFNGDRKEQ